MVVTPRGGNQSWQSSSIPAAADCIDDLLASWNDGPAKQAIVAFVAATTDQTSPQFVPPEDRIATFDQDGTLWVEHPLYTQAMFALDRVHELAPKHPEWKKKEPFKAVLATIARRWQNSARGTGRRSSPPPTPG